MDSYNPKFPWHRCNRYCTMLKTNHCDLVHGTAAPTMEQIETADWAIRNTYAHHQFVTVISIERAEAPGDIAGLTPVPLSRIADPDAAPAASPPEGAPMWLVWWTW